MKIKNNNIEKEITILKHFKVENEEYLIYKYNDIVYLSLINKLAQAKYSSLMVGVLLDATPIDEVIIDLFSKAFSELLLNIAVISIYLSF